MLCYSPALVGVVNTPYGGDAGVLSGEKWGYTEYLATLVVTLNTHAYYTSHRTQAFRGQFRRDLASWLKDCAFQR